MTEKDNSPSLRSNVIAQNKIVVIGKIVTKSNFTGIAGTTEVVGAINNTLQIDRCAVAALVLFV